MVERERKNEIGKVEKKAVRFGSAEKAEAFNP
jgi:hypothetical protein